MFFGGLLGMIVNRVINVFMYGFTDVYVHPLMCRVGRHPLTYRGICHACHKDIR